MAGFSPGFALGFDSDLDAAIITGQFSHGFSSGFDGGIDDVEDDCMFHRPALAANIWAAVDMAGVGSDDSGGFIPGLPFIPSGDGGSGGWTTVAAAANTWSAVAAAPEGTVCDD